MRVVRKAILIVQDPMAVRMLRLRLRLVEMAAQMLMSLLVETADRMLMKCPIETVDQTQRYFRLATAVQMRTLSLAVMVVRKLMCRRVAKVAQMLK